MLINKIIVHPTKNRSENFELPVIMNLYFVNSKGEKLYELEVSGKGGEFVIEDPFEHHDCEGRMYALDRTKESGSYFQLYNSGKYAGKSELNVRTAIHGPFACFSLSVY